MRGIFPHIRWSQAFQYVLLSVTRLMHSGIILSLLVHMKNLGCLIDSRVDPYKNVPRILGFISKFPVLSDIGVKLRYLNVLIHLQGVSSGINL